MIRQRSSGAIGGVMRALKSRSYFNFMPTKRNTFLLGILLFLPILYFFYSSGGIRSYYEWNCETFDRPNRGWVTSPEPQNMHGGKWTLPKPLETNHSSLIMNGTLGFEAIYVLGMPDRPDKRDAMELAATLTGLQLTWADGVDPKSMSPKAIPPARYAKGSLLKLDGEVGCWRGHMNVLREIVKKGVSTALILEDDTDWDVNIERQMQDFTSASQTVLALSESLNPVRGDARSDSPYGNYWDILWLGHCGGYEPYPQYHQYHAVIHGDTTVPPAFDMRGLTRNIETYEGPCSTHEGHDPTHRKCDEPRLAQDERIIQFNGSPLCTFGYAVSQQGARKILSRVGGPALDDVKYPIDLEMLNLCRDGAEGNGGVEGMRCLVVSPPFFSTHKPKGSKASDSDIHKFCGSKERDIGYSEGLVWSTRLNIENLIAGHEPEAQYIVNEGSGRWELKRPDQYRSH